MWRTLVEPRVGDRADAPFIIIIIVAVGADGHQAVLCREDALTSGVLLALSLEGHPLDSRHGARLRLVSPGQYGYKNVKHLVVLELHDHQTPATWEPKSTFGPTCPSRSVTAGSRPGYFACHTAC